jgi:amino acid transporter
MVLDIFSLVVVGILLAVVIWLVVLLGSMPGKIAAQRGHQQADAINVLGWIGVITLGLAWPFALVWAYTGFGSRDADQHGARIDALEAELAALKAGGENP